MERELFRGVHSNTASRLLLCWLIPRLVTSEQELNETISSGWYQYFLLFTIINRMQMVMLRTEL